MGSEGKTTLTLCLGSSCFSRGNNELLPKLQALLKERGLEDRVLLRGSRCEGLCSCGPNLRVGDELVQELDEARLLAILERLP